jgi:hypothetical protein
MAIGSKTIRIANSKASFGALRNACADHKKIQYLPELVSQKLRSFGGATLGQRRFDRKQLKRSLPVIAEVVFEDQDEADAFPAKFLHKSKETLLDCWPEALVNPWMLVDDEACCKAVVSLLKDDSCDKSALLAWLSPALLSLAFSDCGSGVVHAVLQVAAGDARTMIASQFHGRVRDLCLCSSGHLVLSELIGTMPISAIGFVASELEGKAKEVARHKFGYRVMEAMLMHGSHVQISKLSVELVQATVVLSKDPYGQHVLQHLLEHGSEGCHREVMQRLAVEMASVLQQRPLMPCKAHANFPQHAYQHQQSLAISHAEA